jgi:hypothetical protein
MTTFISLASVWQQLLFMNAGTYLMGINVKSGECSEMACVVLTSWYLNLPSSEGTLLRLHLKRLVQDILEAAVKFARTLQTTVGMYEQFQFLRDCLF